MFVQNGAKAGDEQLHDDDDDGDGDKGEFAIHYSACSFSFHLIIAAPFRHKLNLQLCLSFLPERARVENAICQEKEIICPLVKGTGYKTPPPSLCLMCEMSFCVLKGGG